MKFVCSAPSQIRCNMLTASRIINNTAYRLTRRFSTATTATASTSKLSNTTNNSTTSSSETTNTTTTLPPWLNHWLNLWDQESGTKEILQLKTIVNDSSIAFDTKQRQVAKARITLDNALQTFEQSQIQHTELLQSRDRWKPKQALEFAKLLEKEVTIRQELEAAKQNVTRLESESLASMNSYMNALRKRYHEEQLWADKWRIYSTYMTWGLIVFNSVVFLISQYMLRMRENQRMNDIKGLLQQSLVASEGTLRAVQEQQSSSMDRDSSSHQPIPMEEEEDNNERARDEEDISKDASTIQESKDKAITSQPQTKHPILKQWTRIKQYATDTSKKHLPIMKQYATDLKKHIPENVDVPSVILGSSITGVAWLLAATLSGRGG